MKKIENLMDRAIGYLKNPPPSEELKQMIIDELIKDGYSEENAKRDVEAADITTKIDIVEVLWKDGNKGLYKFKLTERLYHIATIRKS